MLPLSHRRAYQDLMKFLQKLNERVDEDKIKGTEFQQALRKVQQVFQEQILPLTSQEINPSVVSRWQSIQTEIHRAVKLLQVDGMLLQASRQSDTSAKRQAAMGDRIDQLIGYCQVLLDETEQ